MQPVGLVLGAKIAADQPDIAVQVHRLVRRMRQIDETLALETAELDAQQRPQAPFLLRPILPLRRIAAQELGMAAMLPRGFA